MLTFSPTRKSLLVSFAAPALVAFGLLAGAPVWAQSNDPMPGKPGIEEHHRMMEAHRAEMMQHHLDAAAERLELKASQVPAWQQFAAAFTALHQPPAMAKGHEHENAHEQFEKLDAAGMAKFASDRAADRAKKLAVVADAASKLEATMTDNQRTLFTQMAREHMKHHHHHGMHPGMHMHPGGEDHGGMHEHAEADGFGPPPMAGAEGDEEDAPAMLAFEDDDE